MKNQIQTMSQPTTELEMYNLFHGFNTMRVSAKKQAIAVVFAEMACPHGNILVGNTWYHWNGIAIFHAYIEVCEACYREMEEDIASQLGRK